VVELSSKREDEPGAREMKARRRAGARRRATIKTARWGPAAAIVLLGFTLFLAPSGNRSVSGNGGRGSAVPEIRLTDFGGHRFALSDYGGTPVVLHFRASWCPNCAAEMAAFESVHKDLQGEVAFMGVDQRDERAAADELARRTKVTYRLAEDPTGRVFDHFGGAGMPTTVFIDAQGKVSEVVTGQLSEKQLRGYISDMDR
jgi:peroxiredoxin